MSQRTRPVRRRAGTSRARRSGRRRRRLRFDAPPPRALALSGWALVPLRAFLGVTFCFAGLQKLANPNFFNANSPSSIQAQLIASIRISPLHELLGHLLRFAVPIGIVIALAELAVGLGTILGLWTRVAAAGGMVLAFTLFLTVSFHSSPYYTGADIVFVFAWIPLVLAGSGGVLSLDGVIAARVAGEYDLGPPAGRPRPLRPRPTGVRPLRERLLRCEGRTALRRPRMSFPVGRPGRARQYVVGRGVSTRSIAERSFSGAPRPSRRPLPAAWSPGRRPESAGPWAARRARGPERLARPSAPGSVGCLGLQYDDHATGVDGPEPTTATVQGRRSVWPTRYRLAGLRVSPIQRQVTQVSSSNSTQGHFVAYDAVCPHAGCTVGYSSAANLIVCPCHGSEFDPSTGAVVSPPAVHGLSSIQVAVDANGELVVDG